LGQPMVIRKKKSKHDGVQWGSRTFERSNRRNNLEEGEGGEDLYRFKNETKHRRPNDEGMLLLK